MMDHITTTYRTASAERCFVPSPVRGCTQTTSALAGSSAVVSPFAANQEAIATPAVKTWTRIGGVAPPAPVPFRLS